MYRAKIGPSKLSQEQTDRRGANLIRAGHFLPILTIFKGTKSRENKTFFPSQLFFSILLDIEMKLEKRNGVQIFFKCEALLRLGISARRRTRVRTRARTY